MVDMLHNNGIWTGHLRLDSWNTFFGISQPIEVIVGGEEGTETIEQKHMTTYEYIVSNQSMILENILCLLLREYPSMQAEYGYDIDEIDEYMPNVKSVSDFKPLLIPKRIFILNVEHTGMSYFGVQFDCSWDDGLGVMLYQNRIVAFGGNENAFLSWIAVNDQKLTEKRSSIKNNADFQAEE